MRLLSYSETIRCKHIAQIAHPYHHIAYCYNVISVDILSSFALFAHAHPNLDTILSSHLS